MDGKALPVESLVGFPATVEQLFDYADRNAGAGKIELKYDDRLGYPTALGVDSGLDARDDEIRIAVVELAPGRCAGTAHRLGGCGSRSCRTRTCRGCLSGRVLPLWLVASLEAAEIERILHAGDWTAELAADLLEAIAPVDGVAGNNDGPALHERFGTRRVIEIDGVRIGLTHGHLGPGRTTEERARNAFEAEPSLDAIVFGHSHIP